LKDQSEMGDEDIQTLVKSSGVGTSVAAFGTSLLVFGAIQAYFTESMDTPEAIGGIALLVLGILSRKGNRGAMKLCIWFSGLCLLGSIVAIGLILSILFGSKDGADVPRVAYWYFSLIEVTVLCLWSVTNIVWLFIVLKVTHTA
jgi:hypothetical protein